MVKHKEQSPGTYTRVEKQGRRKNHRAVSLGRGTRIGEFPREQRKNFPQSRVSISIGNRTLEFLTEPAREIKKRTLVTPCGEFTKSWEEEDAQLAQRVEPNSTVGTIVSMRVFEFEVYID